MINVKDESDLRTQIVSAYLEETGMTVFIPENFCDWVRDKRDHPLFGHAWSWVWGLSDEQLAARSRRETARFLVRDYRNYDAHCGPKLVE